MDRSAKNPVHGLYLSATSTEERLKELLSETADEIAHTECFDTEQRAEVYSILEALKFNSETHKNMVHLLAKGAIHGEQPYA